MNPLWIIIIFPPILILNLIFYFKADSPDWLKTVLQFGNPVACALIGYFAFNFSFALNLPRELTYVLIAGGVIGSAFYGYFFTEKAIAGNRKTILVPVGLMSVGVLAIIGLVMAMLRMAARWHS